MTTSLFVQAQNVIARLKEERGAAMAEYGLLIALIAVVAMAVIYAFGGQIAQIFQDTSNALNDPTSIPTP